jgi:hypothetical protein
MAFRHNSGLATAKGWDLKGYMLRLRKPSANLQTFHIVTIKLNPISVTELELTKAANL